MLITPGKEMADETARHVASSPLVAPWLARLDGIGIPLEELEIHHALIIHGRVSFAYVTARPIAGMPFCAFLRGDSVAVLVTLTHNDTEYALMVRQERLAIGEKEWLEIPAGTMDGVGDFSGKASAELHEECGLDIRERDLKLLGPDSGIALSAGGTDERIRLYHLELGHVTNERFKKIGGTYGLAEEGERTFAMPVPLAQLANSADAKTLLAYYELMRKRNEL